MLRSAGLRYARCSPPGPQQPCLPRQKRPQMRHDPAFCSFRQKVPCSPRPLACATGLLWVRAASRRAASASRAGGSARPHTARGLARMREPLERDSPLSWHAGEVWFCVGVGFGFGVGLALALGQGSRPRRHGLPLHRLNPPQRLTPAPRTAQPRPPPHAPSPPAHPPRARRHRLRQPWRRGPKVPPRRRRQRGARRDPGARRPGAARQRAGARGAAGISPQLMRLDNSICREPLNPPAGAKVKPGGGSPVAPPKRNPAARARKAVAGPPHRCQRAGWPARGRTNGRPRPAAAEEGPPPPPGPRRGPAGRRPRRHPRRPARVRGRARAPCRR
jgi:hypothetical protein